MKSQISIYLPLFLFYLIACGPGEPDEGEETILNANSATNSLTTAEKAEGWELLFDGSSAQGWHAYLGDENIGWLVADGILSTPGGQGDIVTDEEFGDFELSLEWKIMEGGNSGIFYFVIEDTEYPRMLMTGPEFQIIDDENYPQELKDNQKTGSNSDVLAPESFNAHSPGNWNSSRIISMGGKIEHWLNGEKILSFDANSHEWRSAIANSKFSEFDYAEKLEGRIGLQDHGGPVAFKNIKIKEF